MSWQLAIAIHLAFSTSFALVYRSFAKANPDRALVSTALMYILTVTPFGIAWGLYSGDLDFSFTVQTWGLLVLGGFLFALANILAFTANSKVEAGQFSILSNFRVVTTILISSLLLSETLTAKQLIGVALILTAAVVIASQKFNRKTLRIDRFTFISLLSAVFMGAGISNEKYLLDSINFSTYLIVGWSLQTLAMAILARKDFKHSKKLLEGSNGVKLIALGLLRTFAGFALVYALKESDNSSLISGFTAYKTALVVIGSYFLLRERSNLRIKILGTLLATSGIFLLI